MKKLNLFPGIRNIIMNNKRISLSLIIGLLVLFISPILSAEEEEYDPNRYRWNVKPNFWTDYGGYYEETTPIIFQNIHRYNGEIIDDVLDYFIEDGRKIYFWDYKELLHHFRVDGEGNIYLHYPRQSMVKLFSKEGKFIKLIDYSKSNSSLRGNHMKFIAVDEEGFIYLTTDLELNLYKIDISGKLVDKSSQDGLIKINGYQDGFLLNLKREKIKKIKDVKIKRNKITVESGGYLIIEGEDGGTNKMKIHTNKLPFGKHLTTFQRIDNVGDIYITYKIDNPLSIENPGWKDIAYGLAKFNSKGKLLVAFPLHGMTACLIEIDGEGNVYQSWSDRIERRYITVWRKIK